MTDFGIAKFRRLLLVSCIGFVSMNLVDVTDTVIVGHLLGEKALVAMNLFWPCVEFQFFVGMSIAAGTSILYSRAIGDFDARRASGLFSNGLLLAGLAGLLMSAGLWLLRDPAVAFYGVTGETLGFLTVYWNIFVLVVLLFPVYVYLTTMIACDGDPVVGTASYLAELAVNAAASYLLCRTHGIAGAAMGVVASTIAGISVAVLHFLRPSNSFVFRWHFSFRESLAAFFADLPESSVSLFMAVVYMIMNKILIVHFGEAALPAMTAVIVTNGFAFFLYGVPPAVQPIVGVYRTEGTFGAVRRVMRSALSTSLVLGGVTAAVFALFPESTVRLIGVETPEVVRQATFAVRTVAYSYPFVAVVALFTGYFIYIERPWLSVSLVALQGAVLPLVLGVFGAQTVGQHGFWCGYAAATPLALLLFFLTLKVRYRDHLEAPPWFLDLTRDVYATSWTLKTTPEEICRVAENVQKRLCDVEAPPKVLAKASLLVEDMLMEIRGRNGDRAVLAEVLLDIRSTGASDGRFDARLILRDDGVIGEGGRPSAPAGDAVFRGEMLDKVMSNLRGRRSRVTTGFNRQEFVL